MSREVVFFKTRAADSKWSGTKEEKTWLNIDVKIINKYNFKKFAKRVNVRQTPIISVDAMSDRTGRSPRRKIT